MSHDPFGQDGWERTFTDMFEQGKARKERLASEQNAETQLTFGEYSGYKLRDVPLEYLKLRGMLWGNRRMRIAAEMEILRRQRGGK